VEAVNAAEPNATPPDFVTVMMPVDGTIVASPLIVNPPNAVELLYWSWPLVPPAVAEIVKLSVLPAHENPEPRVTLVNPPDPLPARSWVVVAVVAGAKDVLANVAAVPRPRLALAADVDPRSLRLFDVTR
jgi:hypothetical protein